MTKPHQIVGLTIAITPGKKVIFWSRDFTIPSDPMNCRNLVDSWQVASIPSSNTHLEIMKKHPPPKVVKFLFFMSYFNKNQLPSPPPHNKKWRGPTMYFMFVCWSRSKCRDLQREGHHRCPRDRGSDGEETASASIGTKK